MADDSRRVYSYHESIGEKNTTLLVPVEPGCNYEVTVTFTGRAEDEGKEKVRPVRIYYEDVDGDQCYANIQPAYEAQGVDDRSALLYETCKVGVTETRTFTVAAIDDSMQLIFVGDAELLDVVVVQEEKKEPGEKRTIFVIGDSLVQTYNSKNYPMTGWGQRLNEFFTEDIIVSNHALGGRSTMNFIKQGRLNAVLTQVRPGDYVFVTFGHNDAGSVAGRGCTVEKYQKYLEDWYIEGVRQRGGIPVMVTLGNQNIFAAKDGKIMQSFPAYVEAMKKAAENKDCQLIDLNQKSRDRFQIIHDELGTIAMTDLVFHGFRPGIYETNINGSADSTHFQTYGAWVLASLVAEGVKENNLEGLAQYYVPPTVYSTKPEAVKKLKINKKDFDENYTHMDWTASENAEYYVIERAVLSNDGTLSPFELFGYSPVNMFADNSREADASYCYRVFAVNNAGRSEESEWLSVGDNAVKIEEALRPSPTPEPTIKVEDKQETDSAVVDDIAVDGSQTKNRAQVAIFVALFAGAYFFTDYLRKKNRKIK